MFIKLHGGDNITVYIWRGDALPSSSLLVLSSRQKTIPYNYLFCWPWPNTLPSLLRIQFQLIVDDQVCNNVSVSAQCYVIHLIMYRSGSKANRALLKTLVTALSTQKPLRFRTCLYCVFNIASSLQSAREVQTDRRDRQVQVPVDAQGCLLSAVLARRLLPGCWLQWRQCRGTSVVCV